MRMSKNSSVNTNQNTVCLTDAKPYTFGPLDLQDYYMEHKRQQEEAMKNARRVILEIGKEFGQKFGTTYGYFETYKMEDAEYGMVCIGSTAGTAKVAIDKMRAEGKKVGLLKVRVFRPFPGEELVEALKHLKGLMVLDRSASFGAIGGPVFNELRAAFNEQTQKPMMRNFIYGLGGRDINTDDLEELFSRTVNMVETGEGAGTYQFYGARGDK
jgi:pyruvate ferredoxin oxidoreductase alpha subunit